MFRYLLCGILLAGALPVWADMSAGPLKSQAEIQKLKEQRRELRQRNARAARDPAAWGVVHHCRAVRKAAQTPEARTLALAQCQHEAARERERLDLQQ
jgi:hypothetical protein